MSLIQPIVGEASWLRSLDGLPEWRPDQSRILIVAPHPDDETLAVGGFISKSRQQNKQLLVVAVTDGEHAYEDEPGLGAVRRLEQENALAKLGVLPPDILRLGLVDREVSAQEIPLAETLVKLIDCNTLLLAPWPGDFHPDHEASGRAATEAARLTQAKLAYYFFWTWHRGTLETLAGLPLHIVSLAPETVATKLSALACHRSQLHRASGDPVLPEYLLHPAKRPFEVILPA